MKKIVLFALGSSVILFACKSRNATDVLAASKDSVYKEYVKSQEALAKEKSDRVVIMQQQPQPVVTSTAAPVAPAKKGWSKAAKGTVIGAASGAVIGAVVNKRAPAVGAVVGGAVGAGVGYGIGRSKDKKDGRVQ